jgi:radical SAM superfamily enzyme YgiQ (UPF0313 family)
MRLYLINPANSMAMSDIRQRWFNRYRVWKPLGLLTVAALTPADCQVTVIDENLGIRDYASMPRPDLVGITAFTSQASRAYELSRQFRSAGVPVVMGGIHASMCPEEALQHVDCVLAGEAEGVWPRMLADFGRGCLQSIYRAPPAAMDATPPARHDLLPHGYAFGALQTTRGCPLSCSFCSVTAFNGARYRHRPIPAVIDEMRSIREKYVLVVDDNLIGISAAHLERARQLFRAIIDARLQKRWIAQVTINMGEDEELLDLARRAGCVGVFIGLESPAAEGLAEIGKKFNITRGRDIREMVRNIQRHGMLVAGSFILGLDSDSQGIGRRIADAACSYGLDILNTLFLTPLPGTRLWDRMQAEGRIVANAFPDDWQYYTLTFPVARYRQLSRDQIIHEMEYCDQRFYSSPRIVRRLWDSFWRRRHPLIALVSNLSYRSSLASHRQALRRPAARPAAAHSPARGS